MRENNRTRWTMVQPIKTYHHSSSLRFIYLTKAKTMNVFKIDFLVAALLLVCAISSSLTSVEGSEETQNTRGISKNAVNTKPATKKNRLLSSTTYDVCFISSLLFVILVTILSSLYCIVMNDLDKKEYC